MISEKQHGLMYSVHHPSKKPVVRWFIIFLVLIQLSLIWPIYPLVGHIESFILGMPFSIVWVLFCLLLSFSGLLAFFLWDEHLWDEHLWDEQSQAEQGQDVLGKAEQSKILSQHTTNHESFSERAKS